MFEGLIQYVKDPTFIFKKYKYDAEIEVKCLHNYSYNYLNNIIELDLKYIKSNNFKCIILYVQNVGNLYI